MKKKQILAVGFKFLHHNSSSGYDELVRCKDYNFIDGGRLPLGGVSFEKRIKLINLILLDLLTIFYGLRHKVVHYIYPENSAFISPIILSILGKRIVYTVHLDKSFWQKRFRNPLMYLLRVAIRFADCIVVLSKNEVAAFKSLASKKAEVKFIPHGYVFDPLVFSSSENPRSDIVAIGENYRDLDLLESIIKTAPKGIRFQLIGMRTEACRRFTKYSNVVFNGYLNEEQYREVLRNSLALCLPLTFATANNALMDAYAFGCIPIVSDIPGAHDYFVKNTLTFSGVEDFWVALNRVATIGEEMRERIVSDNFKEAESRFSWAAIRGALHSIY